MTTALEKRHYKSLAIPFQTWLYTLIPDNSWADKQLHCFDLQPHCTVRLFVRSHYLILWETDWSRSCAKALGTQTAGSLPQLCHTPCMWNLTTATRGRASHRACWCLPFISTCHLSHLFRLWALQNKGFFLQQTHSRSQVWFLDTTAAQWEAQKQSWAIVWDCPQHEAGEAQEVLSEGCVKGRINDE